MYFKSSSLFLVYLCGRITAPHTGLAIILHHFESVSVVSCVRRYFSRQHRVYGRTRRKRSDRESSGFVWMSPQSRAVSDILFVFCFLINIKVRDGSWYIGLLSL